MNKKFFILASLFIFHFSFLTFHSYAQSWLWARSGNGSKGLGSDQGFSVATDKNGNVYVVGYFGSTTITFGTYTLTNPGGYDNSFLVKYDSGGNLLWAKCMEGIAGSVYAQLGNVATDNSGNVLIFGSYDEPGLVFGKDTLTLLNNNGDNNIFLAKYDANGNLLWATSPTVSNLNADIDVTDGWSNLVTDSLNNIYITGDYAGNIIFGKDSLIGGNGGNIFYVKYDSYGNVVWAKNLNGSSAGAPEGIVLDRKDNVYISGTFSGLITFGPDSFKAPAGGQNIFLAKYDANGTLLWAKDYGGGTDCDINIYSMALDKGNNIYLGGDFSCDTLPFGSDTLYEKESQFWSPCLFKFDENGNPLWARGDNGQGPNANDYVSAVTVTQDGNICITGWS